MSLRVLVALAAALLLAACDGEKIDYADSDRYDISWLWVAGTADNTPASLADPGARTGAVTWVDADGVVWLFGGHFEDGVTSGSYQDLWKYDGLGWTWVLGASTADGAGVYGTPGSNIPGARRHALGWQDADGNLWLFGGEGRDADGDLGELNDLWKFDGTAWTWVGGSDQVAQPGVYGTALTADPANVPGARHSAAGWQDADGNFWLFGGYGYDDDGGCCYLNDIWMYDVALGQWAWMKGAAVANQGSVYNSAAPGTPDATHTPGARYGASAWYRPATGKVWLFGGIGLVGGTPTAFNDLWTYDRDDPAYTDGYNNWTWVIGTPETFSAGIYGPRGAASTTAVPPARSRAVAWIAPPGGADTLYLFGGKVEVAAGQVTYPNDLWRFDGLFWTWLGGSERVTAPGSYPAIGERGQPAGRAGGTGWTDELGNLWLFGGTGLVDDTPTDPSDDDTPTAFSDLWLYSP